METAIKKTNSIKITTKKMLCIVLVVLLGIPMGLLVACSSDFNATTFTYRRTIGGMPLNWSAHEWVSSTDSELLDYFQAPFYSRYEELDANGKPTFDRGIVNARSFPETAVSWPQDVTYAIATRSDGNHFGLDQGLDESNTENGGMKDNYERRAYSIPLRADLRWENGELITLDEFEWSMQMLLAPNRMPRRSDTFRLGDVALVGANAYNSQWRKDWQTEWQYGTGAQEIDINEYIPGYDSLQKEQQEAEIKNLEESSSDADKQNAVKIRAKLAWIAKWKLWNDGRDVKYRDSSTVEWDEVGFEIDDSTAGQTIVDPIYGNEVKTMGSVVFIYNNTAPAPINEHSMEDLIWSRWGGSGNDYLVYKDTFLANDTLLRPASDPASTHTVNLLLSNYGTSAASTVSSGPYKFLSMSPTNIILQKNPYWFGNNVKEFGSHFVATHININVISDASTRRMMFLNGLLDEFSLTGGDTDLAQSSRLRAITDTFSLRLFFNIDRDALNSINGKMNGSENLQYLANANFRQAFSLAMNRTAIAAAASPVATPSVVLWNQAYFNSMGYDYSDPNPENWIHRSQYRYSDTGLRAVVGKYSEDTDTINSLDSAKLREEYSHLTGFNASRAKELFAKAREEELALQNIPDNGQIVNVNMSIYLGNAAAVGTRATMLKAVQDSLNAVTPDNLKVTATPRAYWLEGKQYDGINNGLIEAIFGGWGGSSGAIASPLTSFLGLGLHDASMSNGSVYGMNSYDFSVNPDNKLSIDMSFILDKEKNVNVDPRAVKLAEDIYNAKTNGEFVNRDPDSEYTMRMFPRQYGVLFGEDNNDQIYTHVNAQGVEIKYDHVDYSFLPKNADGTNDMTYVGSWNRIEFLNEVIPWLERYLLDLHGQVPLYMDTQANLVSHRFETPLDGPDAILFRAGSFRLSKMTMNDGQWARSINGTRNRNRLMQSYFL